MAGVMVLGSCGGIAELLGLEEDEEESSSELSSDIIDVAAAVFETDAEDLECVLVLDNDGATWAQKSIPTFTTR